jgi:biopolymer transport protein ExbD
MKDPGVIIQADALATHQSVVRVMDAAQQLGLARMIISTQRVGAR